MPRTYHLSDAIDLAELILEAAEELHGSPEVQAIVEAGRGPELRRLTAAVAARAALAVRMALSGSSPT